MWKKVNKDGFESPTQLSAVLELKRDKHTNEHFYYTSLQS